MLRARGAVSLFTVFLLLGLAVAGYLGWLLVPLWLDQMDVREATSAAFNRMNDPDDERTRNFFLSRTKRIGTHWEEEGGLRVEKPGLDLTAADVVMEHDLAEHTAHIQVDYTREVRLWPTERFHTFEFHAEKGGKLPQ